MLPFRFVTADKSMLDQRGYSLQRDLKLVDILEPDDIKAGNDYGMKSKQVMLQPKPNKCWLDSDPGCNLQLQLVKSVTQLGSRRQFTLSCDLSNRIHSG